MYKIILLQLFFSDYQRSSHPDLNGFLFIAKMHSTIIHVEHVILFLQAIYVLLGYQSSCV
jgi:hypothetical protein